MRDAWLVQALVEHFSQKGQPEAVEKAVLHMDIASLDLNQVSQLHLPAHSLLQVVVKVLPALAAAAAARWSGGGP